MRLVRFGDFGRERPGVLDDDDRIRDASRLVEDWRGAALSDAGLAGVRERLEDLPVVDAGVRIGPPVSGIGKIVCIGLNYADHAAETGAAVPVEPVLFLKATSAVAGPFDDLPLPIGAEKTDWEVELAAVIGKRAQRVSAADALDHVAGYVVHNDLSERAWQLEGTGTWDKGKGHDGFAPLGPWLVTRDEIPDPQNLRLWLTLNGERVQNGSTHTMVFGVAALIAYVSRFMTLHPGDVISTGTPPGVGLGFSPPRYLKAGDVVRAGVEGLGEQALRVRPPPA